MHATTIDNRYGHDCERDECSYCKGRISHTDTERFRCTCTPLQLARTGYFLSRVALRGRQKREREEMEQRHARERAELDRRGHRDIDDCLLFGHPRSDSASAKTPRPTGWILAAVALLLAAVVVIAL